MIYGSVCSGIEAATMAWHPLGFTPAWFCEIEPFPSAVLAHHYPEVPNYGDFTKLLGKEHPRSTVDVLVGGTPCQAFSVAGLRRGLADPRGNLALAFVALVDALRPRWVVWENVPGVLSVDGGRAFGSFLGGLGELGYGWAYRVMDAQYFGLAQRRKRVFVVASPGDWRRPAAVLFEPESLRRDSPPRRETGQGTARSAPSGPGIGGVAHALKAKGNSDHRADSETYVPTDNRDVAPTLTNHGHGGGNAGQDELITVANCIPAHTGLCAPDMMNYIPVTSPAIKARDFKGPSSDGTGDGAPLIAHTLRGNGHDASEDGTGRGVPMVPVAYMPARTLAADGGIDERFAERPICDALHTHSTSGNKAPLVRQPYGVRRLMPHELERLQGFPDHFTQIPYRGKGAEVCPDGPRAKALGNSMAVPVMAWIGRRILLVDAAIPR